MLAKFLYALIGFVAGSIASAAVYSSGARELKKIHQIEASEFEDAGYKRGWEAANNSTWMRYNHYWQYKRELDRAANQS